jgi:hypothetical protein
MGGHGDAPVRTRFTSLYGLTMGVATLLSLSGCGGDGGGGGGGGAIPPFDLQVGVIASDLDGDGWADVAVTNTYVAGPPPHPGSLRVYLHESAGPRSFRAPVRYDVGADPWALTAADVSADGWLDLIASTPDSDQLWLLEQDPTRPGSFLTARGISTPRAPYEVTATDLDGDGRTDLAVALNSISPGGAALLVQDPQSPGTFGGAVQVPFGVGGLGVAAADLNGDGRADLLLASPSSDPARAGLRLALQDPLVAGTFRPAVRLEAGQKPAHVVAADLDGDGHLDLIIANDGINAAGSGMTVLLADAARPGQFRPGTFHAMNDIAQSSCVADFNADGRPDIAVAAAVTGLVNELQSVVQLYLQDAGQPGHFVRGGRYAAGEQVLYLAAADLDGDGAVDIVAGDGPQVLYNDPARPGFFAVARPL